MKKPAIALLLVVLAIVVAAGIWLALDEPGRGGRAAPAPAPSEPPAAAAAAPAELVPSAAIPDASSAPSDRPAPSADLAASAATREERRATEDAGGRRIRGTVAFPAGAPADDGLRVIALSADLQPRLIYGTGGVLSESRHGSEPKTLLGTASVGGDGAFQLALATSGDVWLALDGRFLYSARATKAAAGANSVALAAELGGCLAGRVRLPAGAEAAAFEELHVELGPDSANFSMASIGVAPIFHRLAKPDGEGRFELRAVPAEHVFELEIDAEAFADAKVPGLVLEPGRVREVEVALARGATVRGRVRDEEGRPVAGAEVRARETGMWGFPGEELAETESGEDGSFVLAHVAAGKCLLFAGGDGWLESEGTKVELADEEDRGGVELVLSRGASISGRVVWPDGSPAAGAEVEVDFDPAALAGMAALNAARGAEADGECDAEGRFEVGGLGRGPFVVQAEVEREGGDGKEEWRAKAAGIKPGARDVELQLTAPARLAGRVVDQDGTPVVEFAVVATLASPVFFVPGRRTEESFHDEAGDFVLRNLAPGSYTVEAHAEGYGPMAPLELDLPRADDARVELVLAPAATVTGKVVDPRGAPVLGARVTLQAEFAERIGRMQGGASAPEATSGEGGAFVLGGLAGGTSTLVASREGFAASAPVSVEVGSGKRAEGVVLELRKGATLTGEVYAADGEPAGGVQIVAQVTATQETSLKRADATGAFRFESLAPGAYTVTALLEGTDVETDGSDAEVSASFLENMRFTMVELEDGEEEHVVLGAPPKDPVRVRGRVLHAGEPVREGLVTFMGEGAKGLESLKMAPLRDGGRYETELAQPGRYAVTVQLTGGGGGFRQDNVEYRETIPEVDEHVLDLDLPVGAIRGRVRGPDKKPLPGARVTLATEGGIESGSILGGNYAEATADEAGNYAFECLRPGTYAVAAGGAMFGGAFGAQTTAGRRVRTGLVVGEGEALEGIDFDLEEPGDIRGKVVDASGAPVKDLGIFVRDERGSPLDRFSMISSGADGTFTYTGVAPGSYQVSARGKGLASADSAPVRVRAGEDASVELVVHAGTKLVVEVVDSEGEPVQARIRVTDSGGREMQGLFGFAEMASGFSDGFDSDRQVIGPLAPGAYTVTAVAPDGSDATKPVTLDGQPERRLKLRLR